MKFLKTFFLGFVITTVFVIGLALWFYGPVSKVRKPDIYVRSEETIDVAGELVKAGYIRSANAFGLLYIIFAGDKKIEPGGYRLDPAMNSWEIITKLTNRPDLVWVSIREGLRKEQIGEILVERLGWSQESLDQWNTMYTLDNKPEYAEGVYFPDTYLIPRDETVKQVAGRFISHFNEKFAPYLDKFTAKDIRWVTGLKIASLIQREAGGSADMKLISGIIWNRLDKGMKLEIDATMQYTRGKVDGKWWGGIDLSQKRSDSRYNSYLHAGLPPTPIANPGLAAIEAALNPQTTDCFYYLHDHSGQIHCAQTYQGHLENIEKYL